MGNTKGCLGRAVLPLPRWLPPSLLWLDTAADQSGRGIFRVQKFHPSWWQLFTVCSEYGEDHYEGRFREGFGQLYSVGWWKNWTIWMITGLWLGMEAWEFFLIVSYRIFQGLSGCPLLRCFVVPGMHPDGERHQDSCKRFSKSQIFPRKLFLTPNYLSEVTLSIREVVRILTYCILPTIIAHHTSRSRLKISRKWPFSMAFHPYRLLSSCSGNPTRRSWSVPTRQSSFRGWRNSRKGFPQHVWVTEIRR